MTKGHQGSSRTANAPMAKVSPVDLGLLAGQGAQAQVGLGLAPWAQASR
ncbi:MAG: hypothetical protein IPO19_15250 [Rhodoferax sp.]|nr:hypothetical protein [Rhodoferax sp.]